jgi:hypothetical protein
MIVHYRLDVSPLRDLYPDEPPVTNYYRSTSNTTQILQTH